MPTSKKTLSNIKNRINCERDSIILYNSEEAAEYIGVSRQLIADLCKNGGAPRHYLTGDVIEIYFDKQSLDELHGLLRPDHE